MSFILVNDWKLCGRLSDMALYEKSLKHDCTRETTCITVQPQTKQIGTARRGDWPYNVVRDVSELN